MQNANLTFKIELFGNLIEELNYWHRSCDEEFKIDDGDDLQYCEDRFLEALMAVRAMRQVLLEEFTEYERICKTDDIPIDLGYYRIKKQLQESTFDLLS